MESNDTKLLEAIHRVDKRVASLETKIDDTVTEQFKGVYGRFRDNERRILLLEENQRKVVFAVIGAVIAAVMALIVN